MKTREHIEGAPTVFQKAKHMVPASQSSQQRRRTPYIQARLLRLWEVSFPCNHWKSRDLNTGFS